MFRIIRRLYTTQRLPIYFNLSENKTNTPEGYEEEYKPNPDYDKEKLENDKKDIEKKNNLLL